MKPEKLDLHVLALCIFALIFFWGGHTALQGSIDFVPVYTGARCLIHGCNPYNTAQLEQQYFQGQGRPGELPQWFGEQPLYPPSTLLVLSPLALLSFPVARLLWYLMNGCLFITAVGMTLFMCPRSHRWLATTLASLILLASEILLVVGNLTIFAISLTVIGSYLFLRSRFLPLGSILLMLSLAVKPQLGIFIVLYLIAGRIHWRYAALAAAGAFAILLSAGLILSHHPRSAGWTSDLPASISADQGVGGWNDPRPGAENAVTEISLQPVLSIFSANARMFNSLSYAIFLALLAMWIVAFLRTNESREIHFLSLGALSALTLTPVYHRFYDTRLLLIGIPAIVIIFERRRLLGASIGALTALTLFSVQYRVQLFLLQHGLWQSVLRNKLLFILLLRQQNLELLILFCLYVIAVLSIRFPSAEATKCPLQHNEFLMQRSA